MPLNTIGCTSLKPGNSSVEPSLTRVTVSPILMSAGSRMVPTIYPTWPASNTSTGFWSGLKMPTSRNCVVCPLLM